MAHSKSVWQTGNYMEIMKLWPKNGNHVLAQYDDHNIVVYQAFCPEIANYAVKNQRFGGPHYSFDRMSWIKPNFLWMMYRCGWATKSKQERVLAVRITREGFDSILSKAYSAQAQKAAGLNKNDIQVRLQWDPDHKPSGAPTLRRAIQLGLKGEILRKYATEWIVSIEDVTPFVQEEMVKLTPENIDKLVVPIEKVYHVTDKKTANLINVEEPEL
ncbi:uncharacterized protein LOC100367844 [Saccoglossus kowalevskii]|uniref:Uncharacterized protein LOC100367844 n=1 Tax=Saccoglossus kowalevskii TaxID=10224 RepID=A0ABM0GWI2_SACKO|nr:PREDICTED: uncharacterized protein LOC100367844 [Saccoglossus kowalevskii]